MVNSCGEPVTVTVTQTILQGAATSTTNAPANSLSTTGEPSVQPSDGSTQISGSNPSSTADDQSSSIAFGLLAVVSDTTLTTMAPPTTLTLNLVTATPSSKSSTKASSTSSECQKPTASKAAVSGATKPSTPPGTIAGGVIGSVAGLGLLLALLLYCCRKKRKITFKRKVVHKTDSDEASHELEAARQEKDDVVRQLEQARKDKPLPSPRSFDFGLPKIRHSTSPVMPQRWI